MLLAADDPASEGRGDELDEKLEDAERAPKPSLDDLFSKPEEKPDWPT